MIIERDYFLDKELKTGDILYSSLESRYERPRVLIFIGKITINHEMFWLMYEYGSGERLHLRDIYYEANSTWKDWILIRS